jgi:outer membrane protein OmpA-like peptidoglycan-associated protein
MPDDDGRVGQVAVDPRGNGNDVVLTRPRSYVEVARGVGRAREMNRETVNNLFGAAIAAKPPKPASFLLYFQTESTVPVKASMDLLPEIVQAIQQWPRPMVTIIGHTDSMGDRVFNDRLSMQRAETVHNLLVEEGVPPGIMETRGHGENDPLVPTPPGVSEPKNRRVEIFVR